MEATPMEPNGTGESGAAMERNKVSTKGKASKKAPPMAKSVATVSTNGKTKLNATPKITTTVWQFPNTAADGEQSLPDAWSEARHELLQRIQLAYPSVSEEETKDHPTTNVAKRTKSALSSRMHRSQNKQAVLDGQRLYREKQRVVKSNLAASAAKKKEYRQTKRAKKSQMRQADEQPQVKDFLMEYVKAEHPIIQERPELSRGEMADLDVELNPRPSQPLNDSEALQDEIDFVEGVLDDINLLLTLELYSFQPLEDPTAIHGEVQFIEEALHDIDLGEDPPCLPHDPVQDAI
ncbi:hypothetical protein H257_14738 [Aphanomyces astaci]|uniref:Uncharacterized protein n=1 Tax=Aphanomyces astaci TaxID=112090 RepID=W4FS13_APHAT|nr:hypothetical protein H257_14738 [Aphanomyces astaci]ETV69599.1 hypothetical protein H257_14738 [Aphanomyces astaci]|eukprot:XP_009840926.1 hypothetical protein H257_14738 [Aphanomyces astaci]